MNLFAYRIVLASILGISGFAAAGATAAQPESAKPSGKEAELAKPKALGDPYPFSTCPVSGGKLGSMGEPVVKNYDGREVRFCCDSCPPEFEKDQTKSLGKLDDSITKDQLPLYPIATSVVSGRKLPEKPVDWVYNNRLVRLADDAEKAEFQKAPAKYLAVLDKATTEKQAKDYPLKACPVSEDALGAMGEIKDLVIAGRLIRLCCPSCVRNVRKDPSKFIAMIDEARKGTTDKKGAAEPDAGRPDVHKH